MKKWCEEHYKWLMLIGMVAEIGLMAILVVLEAFGLYFMYEVFSKH